MAQQGLRMVLLFAFLMVVQFLALTSARPECGNQAGGAKCPLSLCCNRYGYCGGTADDCVSNCQSNCKGGVRGVAIPYLDYTPSACYGDDETQFPKNWFMAKVGDTLWNDGKNCGKDLKVACRDDVLCLNKDFITVKIVDHCRGCEASNPPLLLISVHAVANICKPLGKPFHVEYELDSPHKAKEAVPWVEQELIIAEVGQIGHTSSATVRDTRL